MIIKFLNKERLHNGMKYKKGVNWDKNKFDNSSRVQYVKGGLYSMRITKNIVEYLYGLCPEYGTPYVNDCIALCTPIGKTVEDKNGIIRSEGLYIHKFKKLSNRHTLDLLYNNMIDNRSFLFKKTGNACLLYHNACFLLDHILKDRLSLYTKNKKEITFLSYMCVYKNNSLILEYTLQDNIHQYNYFDFDMLYTWAEYHKNNKSIHIINDFRKKYMLHKKTKLF